MYQVIKECKCAGNCYRMDHMESVLDYSEVQSKDGTNTTDVIPTVRVRWKKVYWIIDDRIDRMN